MSNTTASLEEIFNCTICFNPYDTHGRLPMLLPCQHTICSTCLPNLVKFTIMTSQQQQQQQNANNRTYIQCPFCNTKYFMRAEDVPKNRMVIQLLEASHGNLNSIRAPPLAQQQSTIVDQTRSTTGLPYPSAPSHPFQPPPYPSTTTNSNMVYPPSTPSSLSHTSSHPPSYPPLPTPTVPHVPSQQSSNYHSDVTENRSRAPQWDEMAYLRNLFGDVDSNNDGTITFHELHSALIKGQPNSQFDIKTAELLVRKYDQNFDGEINFNEFQNLFNYLNEEYLKFLLADSDGSQTIDTNELEEFLRQRGFKFSKDFSSYIINTIQSRIGRGVTFDYYCRIMARVDQLIAVYNKTGYYKQTTMENYIKKAFFGDFW